MKKFLNLIVLIGLLFTLSACSKKQQTENVKTEDTTSKGKGFLELANEDNTRFWYSIDVTDEVLSKDSKIAGVYVIKNNRATAYQTYDTSLRDISGKSNKELLKLFKKEDKECFDYNIEDLKSKNTTDEEIQKYAGKLTYKYYRDTVSNIKISGTYQTDTTGNNIISEEFLLPNYFMPDQAFDNLRLIYRGDPDALEADINNDISGYVEKDMEETILSFDFVMPQNVMIYKDEYTGFGTSSSFVLITKDYNKTLEYDNSKNVKVKFEESTNE